MPKQKATYKIKTKIKIEKHKMKKGKNGFIDKPVYEMEQVKKTPYDKMFKKK